MERQKYTNETEKLMKAIQKKVRPESFETFFKPCHIFDIGEDYLQLAVKSSFHGKWLEDHHLDALQEIAGKEVKFTVPPR